MKPISRILVPIDFSEDSERALQLALRFADVSATSLLLLHVVQDQTYASDLALTSPPEPIEKQIAGRAEDALKRLAERAIPTDYRWAARTAIGRPSAEIVKTAAAEKTDLIVMGTLGLTGLRHLLIGSTAERVVRTAPCPVLTDRRHPDE